MDLKLIFSTFAVIFLAELGDKTQLAAMAASAGNNQPFSVLLGASLALVLSSVIAVAVGSFIGKVIPMRYIKIAAGVIFLFFGVLYIRDAFVKEKPAGVEKTESAAPALPQFFGKSIIRTARAFEQRELELLRSVRNRMKESGCRSVLDAIIAEEEEQLRGLSDLKGGGGFIRSSEHRDLIFLHSGKCGEGGDDDLLRELFEREQAMADFYLLMSQKSKLASAKSVFNALIQTGTGSL